MPDSTPVTALEIYKKQTDLLEKDFASLDREQKMEAINASISLGTMNPRIFSKFFNDMKLKSFTYDYIMQRELVNLNHVTLIVSKARNYMVKGVYSDTYNRVLEFSVDLQFTTPKEREHYKRSAVFRKYIDYKTLNANHKFFRHNVLVMAGDHVLTNYRLKGHNDHVDICFEYAKFDKRIRRLEVYFIPESVCTYLETPMQTMFNNKRHIRAEYFDVHGALLKPYIRYIGFWIAKDSGASFMLTGISYNTNTKEFVFPDQLPTNIENFSVLLIGIKNMHAITDFGPDTTWIQYHTHKMPVPKDNFMIFIFKNQRYQINNGSVKLKEYYPNLYKIENPHKYRFRVVELYEENSQNEHIEYDNEVKDYLTVMQQIPGYTPEKLSSLMLKYKPVNWDYNIDTFLNEKAYHALNLQDKWDSTLYKVGTLAKMLKKWAYMYAEYQARTFGFNWLVS